ncbi:MAG TPA: ABC transporter permease [Acidimicrobiales bacterium]|nr:ABC transporter permease [Acidimicrobiales bacterium]
MSSAVGTGVPEASPAGAPAGPDGAGPLAAIPPVLGVGSLDARFDATRRRRQRFPVVSYLVTIFVLISFNFALPRLMPGDPIDALLAFGSPNYVTNDETRGQLAEYYDLDESLPQQYVHYLTRLAHGDLGVSIVSNVGVGEELGGRVGWSLLLITTAMLLSIAIGIPPGVHSGWKRGKRVDRGLLSFFLALQNLPIFLLGAVAFVIFSAKLGVFPLGGGASPFNEYSGIQHVLDVARHLTLPALLMGLDSATYEYLVMRSSMVGELGSDYLLGGRAKGLRERRLKYRYAGRNALLPVVTVVGLSFSMSITNVVFVERIFSYPGVGGYMFEAIGTRDYPAMQGAFLVLTITVVLTNLAVDLLYRRLDPRTAR